MGPDALLDYVGRPTEQFRAAASLFRRLAPHRNLLRRLRPTSEELLTANGAAVGCFQDPTTGVHYAVVVNRDLAAPRTVRLTPGAGIGRLDDVLAKKRLPLRAAGEQRAASMRLAAGEGCLLKLLR